jgi:hypothetical protein
MVYFNVVGRRLWIAKRHGWQSSQVERTKKFYLSIQHVDFLGCMIRRIIYHCIMELDDSITRKDGTGKMF